MTYRQPQKTQPTRTSKARFRPHHRPMSEINVTPMVDVMLVLLIVFMIAAPLLTVGVSVNLPQARAPALSGDDEPLAITITESGELFVQDTQVVPSKLIARLQAIAGQGYNQRIYVRGDTNVPYGTVADIMARINAAGFVRVALVTQMQTLSADAQPTPDTQATQAPDKEQP